MTSERRRPLLAAPILAAALLAVPAVAQDAQRPLGTLNNFSLTPSGPQPTPTPTATPPAVVSPPTLSLPAIAPTPLPDATPAPRRSPVPRATPTPTPTAKPVPVETPTPTSTPAATPTPEPGPTAAPPPTATPSPIPTGAPPAAQPERGSPLWPWLAGAALLALLGGWAWSRRRRPAADLPNPEAAVAPAPAEPAVPAPPTAPRARLALALRPTRAGLNMLSATVDCEVTVTNYGDAPATDIRLKAQLLSAVAGQEAAVATFAGEPIARPAAPAFALAPGEERRLRTVVALPRDAIQPMTAGGRSMFIPLVALNALYAAGDGVGGQTVQAFAVGVERVDSPKLAPLWLDGPPRMHDAVAARAHAVAVER